MTVFDLHDSKTVGWTERADVSQWSQPPRSRSVATAAQNVHSAISLHRQGRLREAEQLYRAVLEVNESDFDCLHNLGLGNLALSAIANVFSLTFSVASPTKILAKKLTPP